MRPTRTSTRRLLTYVASATAALLVASAALLIATESPAGAVPAHTTVTVMPGDTLSGIAAQLHVTMKDLAAANGITNYDHIEVGQVLVVPGAGAPAAASPTYVVKAGDTLAALAAKYGTTISAFVSANNLTNPNLIVIGSKLVIPSGGVAATPAAGSGLPERLLANPDRLALRPTIDGWADTYGVPRALLEGLLWVESGWQNSVVSYTGAVGIGQLMPATVDYVNDILLHTNLDPNVASDNIRMAAAYLGNLIARAGSTSLGVAAYYQGLAAVQKYGVYSSTATYVAAVLAFRDRFAAN